MYCNQINSDWANLMKTTQLATFIFSVLMMSVCAAQSNLHTSHKAGLPAMNESNNNAPNQISSTGTVRFQEIEGGFWGIVADDGQKFDPMNLDPKFQKDGLRVSFKAIPETDMMSTHMWGTLIKLTHIEKIK